MEAKIAPSKRTKPERTSYHCTRRKGTALSFQFVPGLPQWVLGVNGLPVLKHAILRVSKCLKLNEGDPAMKHYSLQMIAAN